MTDSVNPNATTNVAATFLPRLYRTDANTKFLHATVEQMSQQGTVTKLNGYIGRQTAKATIGTDVFIKAADEVRQNYQLEPASMITDQSGNYSYFKDYQDYINKIQILGGNVANHQRINSEEFYSWDPQINWDKFVNFQNYYWLTPSVINIGGTQQGVVSSIAVDTVTIGNTTEYVFTPNGISANPVITLYKGQTYVFNINSPGNPFSIKTSRSIGSDDRYATGVQGYSVENGTIIFAVDDATPDTLYYQSETDINAGGIFEIKPITEDTIINVELEILGKSTYTLDNGYNLSNGMLVAFTGNVTPSNYRTGTYYVEGVGTAIQLISSSYIDTNSTLHEYILINKASSDKNPWSRANRWVHADVINVSDTINDTRTILDQAHRAIRPIIEFSENLKLFNYGTEWLMDVNLLDDYTTDAFSLIEGTTGYYVDDVRLLEGDKIIIISDLDDAVKNNIYQVTFINSKIHLELVATPELNQVVYIKNGTNNSSKYLWFNGITWITAQQKAGLNYAPLFDVVDENLVSLSDISVYDGSTFKGTYVFSYKVGTGDVDAELNFPLSYRNISNIGDILFNFDFITDTFYYKKTTTVISKNICTGYLIKQDYVKNNVYLNGWQTSVLSTIQAGVRIYKDTGIVNNFNIDIFDDITKLNDLVVKVYINGTRLQQYSTLNKPNWILIDTPVYKQVVLLNSITNQVVTSTNSANNLISILDTTKLTVGQMVVFGRPIANLQTNVIYYVSAISSITEFSVSTTINGNDVLLTTTDTAVPLYCLSDINTTDIITIKTFADQPINKNGYYEIPNNLQNNPLNDIIKNFTLSEVSNHVDSIVDNLTIDFVGVFPGSSNLRDLGYVSPYGTKFIKHSGPSGISMYHITSDTANIIKAIEQSRDDYGKFKRNFVTISESLGIDTDTKTHVDLILQSITQNIPNTAPYYFSDMLAFGASISTTYVIAGFTTNQFPLMNLIDVSSLSNQAIGVYLNGEQLLINNEYTLDNQGFVVINITLVNGDEITIYEYENTDGCCIPETPTKLGIWPSYEPHIYKDTSLITEQWMIQGHDGSQVLAYGTYGANGISDYRDSLILELEKRIYNNIKIKYDESIFNLNDIIPSYSRTTDYSLTEFNDVLAPNFYKWTSLVDVDFTTPIRYDSLNPFTFNYTGHFSPDGRTIPGYWRGIYKWILDTDRPNICPWEILGVTIKPKWWDTVYGPAPYTADNLIMWEDISNGILNQPGSPILLSQYIRPYLIDNIPVDASGNLLNPIESGLARGTVTSAIENNYIFGDGAPVEGAWRRSSYYPFSVISSSILLSPAKTLGVILDRSRISRNLSGQLIYNKSGLHISPPDVILPSIYSSTSRVQTAGIINYIVNYIIGGDLTTYNNYMYDLTHISYNLSYRIGAFTNISQFNLILDSTSPLTTGTVFIPPENYSVILNTSTPTKKITYSGVIVSKLHNGYAINGYSKTQPYFKYYPWLQTGNSITVGGISESFVIWTPGNSYNKGQVVQFGTYYYVATSFISKDTTFDTSKYEKISSLPIVGGKTALLRKSWNRSSIITIPYGTILGSIQEVVDFLIGYGEWLKDQGFIFDEFNTNLNQVLNWETSAKEFMFWTTQNWSAGQDIWTDWLPNTAVLYNTIVLYQGSYYRALRNIESSSIFEYDFFEKLDGLSTVGSSVISLSPAATSLSFSTNLNVVDDITNQFNDYEIFRVDGQPISPQFLSSSRQRNLVTFTPINDDGIYNASFYLVQKEHIIVINNVTIFNDLIYDPTSGYKQDRIKVSAYVTSGWYGGFDTPGFIIDEANTTMWESWKDYSLGDVVQYQSFYYSANYFIAGSETFDSTQWFRLTSKPTPNIFPNWTNIATQFTDFYKLDDEHFDSAQQTMAQHLIGYQKRQYLDNIIKDDVSEFKFYQGMIAEKGTQNVFNKLFGVLASEQKESLTFYEEWAVRVGQYGASSSFNEVEFILPEEKFTINPQPVELVDTKSSGNGYVIQQIPTDVYLKPADYNSNLFPVVTSTKSFLRPGGYVRTSEVFMTLRSISDIVNEDISKFTEGDYIWCTFENAEWNVYRFTDGNLTVTDVTYADDHLTILVDKMIDIIVADNYVGITGVNFSGFYKVISYATNTLVLLATGVKVSSPFTDQNTIDIYHLTSQRTSNIDGATQVLHYPLKPDELLWTDDCGDGKWASWIYNTAYTGRILEDQYPLPQLNYGSNISADINGDIVVISTAVGGVYVYNVYNNLRSFRQVLAKPFISLQDENPDSAFGKAVSVSKDGKWIAVGSPNISNACTVSGMPNIYSSQLNNILSTGVNSSLTNQGIVSLYTTDKNKNYYHVASFVSPSPASNQFFGSSLEFGNNCLYIGSSGDNGTVYKINYIKFVNASEYYDPFNSVGTVIHLVNPTNVNLFGMYVVGTGFNNNQQVINVGTDHTTITLTANPDIQPSGLLDFVTYDWVYDTGQPLTGTSPGDNFGKRIKTSNEGTLVISSVGKVSIYKTGMLPQTLTGQTAMFGNSITISTSGEYIAISDSLYDGTYSNQGSVQVYGLTETGYEIYQQIQNLYPAIDAEFGTNIGFMNNYDTLVIHSKYANSSSSIVDVYDKYSDYWIYSERLSVVEKAGSFKVNNSYTIVTRGTTDFTTIGAANNNIGTSFTATGVGTGTGTAHINLENDVHELGFCVTTNSILVGSPFKYDVYQNAGLVFEYSKPTNVRSWNILHKAIDKPDVTKIKKALVYNKSNNNLITYLDVIDPLQGKIAGPADQELSFKTLYDPAVYSIGDLSVNVDPSIAWTTMQVGKLWWDVRTTKFVESYDLDSTYRTSTWNTLLYGASVDIYEWVETKLLPAEWDLQADTVTGLALQISGKSLYGNTCYSSKTYYDNVSKTLKNTYYFWVKNKAIVPNIQGRYISAQSISNLIASPVQNAYQYLAITSKNTFEVANVGQILSKNDVVLSIQYWLIDNIDQNIHSHWGIISNDPATVLPLNIEQKWIDSLCGIDAFGRMVPDITISPKLQYGIENRPRQSMFVNRFESLKEYVDQANTVLLQNQIASTRNLAGLKQYDEPPSLTSGLYDVVIDTDSELQFISASSFRLPEISAVITDGKISSVTIIYPGFGYGIPPIIEVIGNGVDAVLNAILNSNGQLESVIVINGGNGYDSSTKLFVRSYSALVQSDSNSNNNWGIYSYNLTMNSWSKILNQSYDTRSLWSYVDWYAVGYNQFTAIDYSVSIFSDLQNIYAKIGNTVKVRLGNNGQWILLTRYSLVESIDWTLSYRVIGIQDGTIQLSKDLYESAQYDGSLYDNIGYDNNYLTELRIILNAIKTDIFIDDLTVEYLNLFFTGVRYAFKEQNYIDWIFKTSFVKANHNVGTLNQPVTFKNDNLKDFENYVAEVKPYRTKVREYVSSYTNIDNGEMLSTDFDLQPIYTQGTTNVIDAYVVNNKVEVYNTEIQQYPWKSWYDNIGFTIASVTIINSGYGYVDLPTITIVGLSGSGAILEATNIDSKGQLTSISIVSAGKGFLSTPTVVISPPPVGQVAKATVTIGNSLPRTCSVKLKFDRITSNYVINELQEHETFTASANTNTFDLKWAPDIKVGYSSVFVNEQLITSDLYTLSISSIKYSNKDKSIQYDKYYGKLKLNSAVKVDDFVSITYNKDVSILNAADRINFYYNPTATDLGKDLSQLMTGIDYGGVIIDGLSFTINQGWDSLPYLSDRWDSYDPTFKDESFIATIAGMRSFTLSYIPTVGTVMNVYYEKYIGLDINGKKKYNDAIRIDDINFGTNDQTNPYGIMVSPVIDIESTDEVTINVDGSITINVTNLLTVHQYDIFVLRESTSDGSIKTFSADYDTSYDGGDLSYNSATGYAPGDIIIDGDGFVTPMTSHAPEEVVPGQVVDTLSIKVFQQNPTVSGNMKVEKFAADGNTMSFYIGQRLNNNQSAIVTVETFTEDDGGLISSTVIQQLDIDYLVDYKNNLVVFATPPLVGSVVSIFSIGINSTDTIDIGYCIGNGYSTEFNTRTMWNQSYLVNVFVNGYPVVYNTYQTAAGILGMRFQVAPIDGAMISYIVVDSVVRTFTITSSEQILIPSGGLAPNTNVTIVSIVGTAANNQDNMIVIVNNEIMLPSTYTYYPANAFIYPSISFNFSIAEGSNVTLISSYNNNILQEERDQILIPVNTHTVDTALYYKDLTVYSGTITLPNKVINENFIWVIQTGVLLTPDVDFILNTGGTSITLRVPPSDSDIFDVITFNSNTESNIAYMQFKDMLNRVHYKDLDANKQTLLTAPLNWNDKFIVVQDISVFDLPNPSKNIPGVVEIGAERIEYFKITKNKLTQLRRATLGTGAAPVYAIGSIVQNIGPSANISYNDTVISQKVIVTQGMITNHNNIDIDIDAPPTKTEIIVTAGAFIINKSYTIVTIGTTDFTSVGAQKNEIGITFVATDKGAGTGTANMWTYDEGFISNIPVGYGQCDDVEVFIGGYDISTWTPSSIYAVGDIVVFGAYTYKCIISHISGNSFNDDVTTVTINPDKTTDIINTNVSSYSANVSKAGTFIVGKTYTIVTVGTTNFTLVGALSNTVGVSFVATGVGVGTGTANINSVWVFFVDSIRLKKQPYKIFNINKSPYSPGGDVQFDADFSVNGTSNQIRLTNPVPVGTVITVVKQYGVSWNNKYTIL